MTEDRTFAKCQPCRKKKDLKFLASKKFYKRWFFRLESWRQNSCKRQKAFELFQCKIGQHITLRRATRIKHQSRMMKTGKKILFG